MYWHMAERVLAGQPLYLPEIDLSHGFKYPPWILPLFLPLGALPLWIAQIIWAFFSILSMWASFYWIIRKLSCSVGHLALVLILTWGIWMNHFNYGQINTLTLAGLLWLWHPHLSVQPLWRRVGLIWVSTIKITSVFVFLHFKKDRSWLYPFAISILVFLLLSLPALINSPPPRFLNLLCDWSAIAGSGLKGFGPEVIRGRLNQGLPVLFGRLCKFWNVNPMSNLPELLGLLIVATSLGIWWKRVSRILSPIASWCGWIAWLCLINPLSWSHNFVLGFPLMVLAFQTAWQARRPGPMILVSCGLICVGLLSSNTARSIGEFFNQGETFVPWVYGIECLSIKSLGLLMCGHGLLLSVRAMTPVRSE